MTTFALNLLKLFVLVVGLALWAGCGGGQQADDTTPDEPADANEPAGNEATPAEAGADSESPAEASGPGAALVQDRCGRCHGLDVVDEESRTRADWERVVDSMIGRGARLDDEERLAVIEYLSSR